MKRMEGGKGEITSKGDGLLRSSLPLKDTIVQGASYFVTVRFDFSKACRRPVEVRRVRFDYHKMCRKLIKVWRARFY